MNSISEKIKLLRPLLIFLIVTTHIQGNLYRPDLKNITLSFSSFFHSYLSGVISVSALPLLSVISGYLAVYTYRKYSYFQTIKDKIYRILIPMLFWNFILALYIYNKQSIGINFRADLALYPLNLENWLYALTGIFRLPANPPLYFLKELFTCFLLLPILYDISKSKKLTVTALLIIAYMSVENINLGFLHRVDIYGFFLAGLFINNNNISDIYKKYSSNKTKVIYLLVFILSTLVLTLYAFKTKHSNFIYYMKIITLIGPLAFWILSEHISGWAKYFLLRISPISFSVFLGHILVLNLAWNIWRKNFKINPIIDHYWLYWLSSIVLCYLIMGSVKYLYDKKSKWTK